MGRVSRKNKASWRKNVDITDVETFLEEQRQNDRIGNIEQKPDSELFSKEGANFEQTALKTSRKKRFHESPKFCWPLQNSSKVPDPIVKRNIKKKISNPSSRPVKTITTIKPKIPKTRSFNVDIWKNDTVPIALKNEWYNESTVLHNLKHTGKPIVKVAPSTHAKPNAVPNIEVPSGGSSYNPSIDDYNELKLSVVEKERKYIKKMEHLDRVVTNKFTKLSKEDREEMIWKEMSEGLRDNDDASDSDTDCSEKEYSSINPPVMNNKKDRKAKNKKRAAISKRNAETIVKTELKKFKDIARIPQLKSELDKRQSKIKQKRENRSKRLEEKARNPRRVAYLQFEEGEADFAEPTELSDSLRRMLPNKSLLVDRFKSLQKRTLIVPKKHRDGILRTNKSTLKKWKRYALPSHKET
ncbi:ribosome biogenesis protein NOP53 [Topomyia yanbarensis]|uniref:ribosome biogenesis protein NOP53 n=1 Tax=Topomyia yanbarensis TaxID=2498891 RepID=UPI00273C560E|nr:ribosome biogenesis protein NOP53 [Topomyia yanbarensis]XP_058822878.1 ribosome biogenesis protein NOP53 [Topomyia yanbarensis]